MPNDLQCHLLTFLIVLLTITQAVKASFSNTSLLARDDNIMWEMSGAFATYYYDLTERDICVKQESPNWSKHINSGVTACGQLPLADHMLNNNRIVALNWTLMNTDRAAYCGKEVEIYQDGQKFEFSEGKFVLWDACERCMIYQLSLAYAELTNQSDCSANHPQDLRVVITKNQLWVPDLTPLGSNVRTSWTPDDRIDSIPLKVTNTSPVFPCRTPGNICAGVGPGTNGVPCPYLIAPACKPDPNALPCTELSPVPTLGPGPAVIAGPVTTPKPAEHGVAAPGNLGSCPDYGKYGCVGKQPAVCDVVPVGPGYNWLGIAPPCAGNCVMQANNSPGCV